MINYDKCKETARNLCAKYRISESEADDIGSDAYILAMRREWRSRGETTTDLEYTSTMDVIRRRKLELRRRMAEEKFAKANAVERRLRETVVDDQPKWLKMFNTERQKLRNEHRTLESRIIRAGLKDSRLYLIRDSLQISGRRFQTILTFFRVRFALVFRALQAYRRNL